VRRRRRDEEPQHDADQHGDRDGDGDGDGDGDADRDGDGERVGDGRGSKPKTLFERLGGKAAIEKVVDDFLAVVKDDKRINKFFATTFKDKKKAEGARTAWSTSCARRPAATANTRART